MTMDEAYELQAMCEVIDRPLVLVDKIGPLRYRLTKKRDGPRSDWDFENSVEVDLSDINFSGGLAEVVRRVTERVPQEFRGAKFA